MTSGVPIPLMARVAVSSTGKSVGILTTIAGIPCSVRYAQKGLPRRKVVFEHALRNALLAPITVITLHINWLIGGIVVVEMLFGFPGIGVAILNASLNKDLYVIEAAALLLTFLATMSQLVADLVYVYLNPRIRYS